MYIERLKIRNLRCFKSAELALRFPGEKSEAASQVVLPNVNLLLGDNGAGKTTVLKALALATLSPVIRQSGFVPFYLVRLRHTTATIQARVRLSEQDVPHLYKSGRRQIGTQVMGASIKRLRDLEIVESNEHHNSAIFWRQMFSEQSPAFFVVGYGATRRVDDPSNYSSAESRKRGIVRYQRIAGLFETQVSLVPLASWLPAIKSSNPGRFKQVHNLLNALLPEEASFTGELQNREFLFELMGEKVPFSALSDGYRAYISWLADLLYHVNFGCPSGKKLVDNSGLVLVDEIDLHLHPNWQRNVIERVAKTLPALQFVFSTHSPIVAGSLHSANIFVMESKEDGAAVVRQYHERIYGLTTDRILESSYFNVPTTRPDPFVHEIQKLTARSGADKPQVALEIMKKLTGESNGRAYPKKQAAPAAVRALKRKTAK